MDVEFKSGDIVFLTRDYDFYWRKKHQGTNLILTNRLAKIERIIDWGSDDGKKILHIRKQNKKWADLPIEDCRYVLSIYFHDIRGRKGESGVVDMACLFSKDPSTGKPFFVRTPEWVYREIAKKCQEFGVEWKSEVPDSVGGEPS